MKIVLDTCVIFPTILRALLLEIAQDGKIIPLWSDRILEEWDRAARNRFGDIGSLEARAAAAMMRARWPEATIAGQADLEKTLWLPDPADVHVLATAIAGNAHAIMTSNARDFPRAALAPHKIARLDPDTYLTSLFNAEPDKMRVLARNAIKSAQVENDGNIEVHRLYKKARLPRFARALSRYAD